MKTVAKRKKAMKDGSHYGYVSLSAFVSFWFFGNPTLKESVSGCTHIYKVSNTSRIKKCMKCDHVEKEA